jgi:single-stranded-DNA-specific exonuclease
MAPGVIGIVASRIADRYDRPAILISLKDGIGKGSGRSIANFNIYQGLRECEDYLISYGGHRYAAGISIMEEDIEQFAETLDEIVRENVLQSDFISATFIEAQCHLNDITHELAGADGTAGALWKQKSRAGPLCAECQRLFARCRREQPSPHARIGSGVSRNTIWFSQGHFIRELNDSCLDIVFTPQINTWNGASDFN